MTPSYKDRLHEVCLKHCIPADRIEGYARRPRIVRARQELMYLLRQDGWTVEAIGEAVNRDHTTVIHGIRQHEKNMRKAIDAAAM